MIAFDLETTGVDPETARIVTACVAIIDGTGRISPKVTTWLVAVEIGVTIPQAAVDIHGVTTEHAREHGQPLAIVVGEILEALAAHPGLPVVGHNAPYDLTVLDREIRRISGGGDGLAEALDRPVAPVVDTLCLDKHVDKYRPGKRTLTAACEHYDVALDGAHDATADAIGAARMAWTIAHRNPAIAAMDLQSLHELQVKAKADQDRSFAQYLRKQAKTAKTADEQVDLIERAGRIEATAAAGCWPLIPYTQTTPGVPAESRPADRTPTR
jgi:DNA polymerase-3 subunit epsilon